MRFLRLAVLKIELCRLKMPGLRNVGLLGEVGDSIRKGVGRGEDSDEVIGNGRKRSDSVFVLKWKVEELVGSKFVILSVESGLLLSMSVALVLVEGQV